MLDKADIIRENANFALDPEKKSSLGQFFTDSRIGIFMASLFDDIEGCVRLLDPGCGPGSLTAAFTAEVIRRGRTQLMSVDAVDIEERLESFAEQTLDICQTEAAEAGIQFNKAFTLADYILKSGNNTGRFSELKQFTHCIMNPPYKKISAASEHRHSLRSTGLETVNLYTGFVALAIQQLKQSGELVTIIPRSFCNGAYYKAFREFLLRETTIKHIHVFDSRNNAFKGDGVLQENIILHLVKGVEQGDVKITSSALADFSVDKDSGAVAASGMTTRIVPFDCVVHSNDKEQFIHIPANEKDQAFIDRISAFSATLDDLNVQVSTGPIVDFRLKDDLRKHIEKGAVPLIYPVHLSAGGLNWPKDSKKPNAISISNQSISKVWENKGYFVIVRRFSAKEEERRIVATPCDPSLPGAYIGFENKLNVFHAGKVGLERELSFGLYIYLNSTLLDKYYRLFGGHTQVNATDLRNIRYPSNSSLRRIGSQVRSTDLNQKEIHRLLNREIDRLSSQERKN
jgi:adenine-specific DNA-methyltransferase